ncbi:hypothetical protein MHU86_13772 [Fragilaria crotonensis]|nr:hypothetical protein MHU86_13772 [Fragilaria crotonensis]
MSSSGKGGKGGGRFTSRATVPGAVSVPANEEPEVAAAQPTTPPPSTTPSSINSSPSAVPEPGTDVPRIPSRPGKQRTVAPATQPGAVSMNSVSNSAVSDSSNAGADADGIHSISAIEPEPLMTTRPAVTSSPNADSPVSSQTAAKGRRTTAPATAPGAVHSAAEEPGRDSDQPRSSSEIVVPQSGKSRRSSAQAASVPGATSVGGNSSQTTRRLASPDGSEGAALPAVPRARDTELLSTTAATGILDTTSADDQEPPLSPGAASTHGVDAARVYVTPEHPGSYSTTSLISQDSSASSRDPRLHRVPSSGDTQALVSNLTASQDLAAKDRRTRRAEPSVPGAHHVAGAQDTSDAVALSKDPRARHEAQRTGGDSAKSRMPPRAEVVTAGEQEPTSVISAEDPEQPYHSITSVGAGDVGNGNRYEADAKVAESSGVSIPEHSRDVFVVDRTPAVTSNDIKDPYDDPHKSPLDEEQPSRGPMARNAAAVAAALTTESRGIGVAPDVTYGTTRGGSNDDNLAVAVAIEDGENERFLPAAIEYDPDSKPPLMKNRRFRLYIISGILLFVIVIVTVILGVVVFKKQPGYGASDAPSLAPTSTMDAKYYQQFAQVLGYNEWNFTSDSPQGAAAQWIIEEDPRNLGVDDETLTQRYLLAVFFYTTTQNGALSWRSCNPDPSDSTITECDFQQYTALDNEEVTYEPKLSSRWMSGVDECTWAGVLCNDLKVLIAIELMGQNITGTIPTELAAFPLVQSLSLAFNEFTGTLPITFALPDSARQLLNLEVHGNYLTGTIPSEYFQATGLQNWNIGQNLFTGTLSTEIGRLTNLKGFHTFDNMLTGTFPTEIGRLEYLSFTRHQENRYTGTIPSELGELILMQELWMYSNQFTGTIPTELGKAPSMVDLELNWNKLTGTIPTEFYQWTSLSRLDLFQNYLNGTIATEIGLLTNMAELRLSRNEFTGTIPLEIVNLTQMELAWFHSNLFVGSVPSGLCQYVPKPLMVLQSDCFPEGSSPNPCDCCTSCCNRDTEICLIIDDNTAP